MVLSILHRLKRIQELIDWFHRYIEMNHLVNHWVMLHNEPKMNKMNFQRYNERVLQDISFPLHQFH
jgi:hypothetical protein